MKTQYKMNSIGNVAQVKGNGWYLESYPDGVLEHEALTELDDLRFENWKPITKYEFLKAIKGRHPEIINLFKEVI